VSTSSQGVSLERHGVTIGILSRFLFINPSMKPRDHVIGYQSHVVWPHRAAIWVDPVGQLEAQV